MTEEENQDSVVARRPGLFQGLEAKLKIEKQPLNLAVSRLL